MMTVVLATHNGSDTLERTFDAFCRLEQPSGGWRLVVVNNASTDNTEEIIGRYQDRLPLLCVMETRLGKSHALNTGVMHVQGDFVVLADDDILPNAHWLTEWRRVADQYPEFGLFGGAIEPAFEIPPPDWLSKTNWTMVLYTGTAPGRPEGAMAADAMDIGGANMAIRANLLTEAAPFDTRLMVGSAGVGGEDTVFVNSIVAKGTKVGFAPTARAGHIVQGHQITFKWMVHRFYRHGRTMYFFERIYGITNAPTLAGIPRYLFRRLAALSLRLPFVLASFDRFRITAHCRLLAYDLGAARQARVMRAMPRQPRVPYPIPGLGGRDAPARE